MRALVQTGYGSPDVLELREVEQPRISPRQVLVRVRAAAVNALDVHVTRGMPYFIRAFDGWRTPRQAIRGVDLAGDIAAVGDQVAGLRPGDRVFGGGDGSFAEYAVTAPGRLSVMPALSYEEAATLNIAGLTALQGLRDAARVRPVQRVLIHGAGGGVGTMAVQIARWLGAHVTAVTRTEQVEVVRSIGADTVIDHRREDFTRRGERWDVIFDVGGTRSMADCRRALDEKGTLVVVGAPAGRWLAPLTHMMRAAALSPFVSQRLVPLLSKNDAAGLATLGELAVAGTLRPVIGHRFELSHAADAIRLVASGQARGKVVITV